MQLQLEHTHTHTHSALLNTSAAIIYPLRHTIMCITYSTTFSLQEGIHFAIAAGNENRDACYASPASVKRQVNN